MDGAATLSLFQFNDRADRHIDSEMVEEAEFETFVRNYQNMVFSVSANHPELLQVNGEHCTVNTLAPVMPFLKETFGSFSIGTSIHGTTKSAGAMWYK
jgi:hypothetical protein